MNFVQQTDAAVDLNLRPCPKAPDSGAHESLAQAPAEAQDGPGRDLNTTSSTKELRVRVPPFYVLHNGHRGGTLH